MKTRLAMLAAAGLLLSATAGMAADTPGGTPHEGKSPGASQYAPGQKMNEPGAENTGPGATEYAPGQEMNEPGAKSTGPGASEYAPGQKKGPGASAGNPSPSMPY